MSKIIADAVLRAKLNGFTEHTQICSESGETLGYFLPREIYREWLFALADAHTSEEELEQARREPGGLTLAEIWKRLGRTNVA